MVELWSCSNSTYNWCTRLANASHSILTSMWWASYMNYRHSSFKEGGGCSLITKGKELGFSSLPLTFPYEASKCKKLMALISHKWCQWSVFYKVTIFCPKYMERVPLFILLYLKLMVLPLIWLFLCSWITFESNANIVYVS